MPKITIGCRLPNGIILKHPNKEIDYSVKLAGRFSSKIVGATHVTTEVDAEFWEVWKKAYSNYQPLRTGAIFEASSPQAAEAKAKELSKEKTGFEPVDKKDGVAPAVSGK